MQVYWKLHASRCMYWQRKRAWHTAVSSDAELKVLVITMAPLEIVVNVWQVQVFGVQKHV